MTEIPTIRPAQYSGKMTITFGATIPTQDYGNIMTNLTWEGEASPEDAAEIQNLMRLTVGRLVLPMVEAQIERNIRYGKFEHISTDPEKLALSNSPTFYWLRTVCPELPIPALAQLTTRVPNGNASPAPAQPAAEPTPKLAIEDVDAQLAALGIPPPTVAELAPVNEPPAKPKGSVRKNPPGAGKLNQPKTSRL